MQILGVPLKRLPGFFFYLCLMKPAFYFTGNFSVLQQSSHIYDIIIYYANGTTEIKGVNL